MVPNKKDKCIRKPVQTRSIHTKERILESALDLFCEKGYYKTSTNEIAQRAQVSIGSLYSYFKDKETIFFEIIERYHQKFEIAKNEVLNNMDLLRNDYELWLRSLIEKLIKVHVESKEFNRELVVLSYYNPKIAEILETNKKRTMKETVGYFLKHKDDIDLKDTEASAIIIYDLISSTVDRVVFSINEIDKERLIDTTIEMICKYLQ